MLSKNRSKKKKHYSKKKSHFKSRSSSSLLQTLAAGASVVAIAVGVGHVLVAEPIAPFVCSTAPATAIVVSDAKPMSAAQWAETRALLGDEIRAAIAPGRRLIVVPADAGGLRLQLGAALHDDCLELEPEATEGRQRKQRAAALDEALAAAETLQPGSRLLAAIPETLAARQAVLALERWPVNIDRLIYIGAGPAGHDSGPLGQSDPAISVAHLSRSYDEDSMTTPGSRVDRVVPSFLEPPRDDNGCLSGVPRTAVFVDVSDQVDAEGQAQIRTVITDAFDRLQPQRQVDVYAIGDGIDAAKHPVWSACFGADGRNSHDLASAALSTMIAVYGDPQSWDQPRSQLVEKLIAQVASWGVEPVHPDRVVVVSDWLQSSAAMRHGDNAQADFQSFAERFKTTTGHSLTGALAGMSVEAVELRSPAFSKLQTGVHGQFVADLVAELTAPVEGEIQ